jgi:hypothetical protein
MATPPPIPPPIPPQTTSGSHSDDSFGTRLKAAGQLAVKQAQRAKVATTELPKAYRALGRHLYSVGAYRDECPELFGELARLSAEHDAIRREIVNRAPVTGFAAKAKAASLGVKDAAQSKTTELRIGQVLAALGEAVYKRHGDNCAPSETVTPVSRIHHQLKALDDDIARLAHSRPGQLLTPKRILLACLCLVALFVLGALMNRQEPRSDSRTVPGNPNGVDQSLSDSIRDKPSRATEVVSRERIDSNQLVSLYKGNEVAADERFKGKVIEVEGNVTKIGKDVLDHPYVVLKANDVLRQVQCTFDNSKKAQLSSISVGDYLIVRGKCKGLMMNVLIDSCELVTK